MVSQVPFRWIKKFSPYIVCFTSALVILFSMLEYGGVAIPYQDPTPDMLARKYGKGPS
jgi:hypothetical protein